MSVERWSDVMARVTGAAPEPLDDLIAAHDHRAEAPGRDVFPPVAAVLAPPEGARDDAVAVGVRVTEPPEDLVDRALRLAAFAIEQDVEVVILAHVEETGFERFGFRVERIAGDDPEARAACEDQIRRFWSIDLVL